MEQFKAQCQDKVHNVQQALDGQLATYKQQVIQMWSVCVMWQCCTVCIVLGLGYTHVYCNANFKKGCTPSHAGTKAIRVQQAFDLGNHLDAVVG